MQSCDFQIRDMQYRGLIYVGCYSNKQKNYCMDKRGDISTLGFPHSILSNLNNFIIVSIKTILATPNKKK